MLAFLCAEGRGLQDADSETILHAIKVCPMLMHSGKSPEFFIAKIGPQIYGCQERSAHHPFLTERALLCLSLAKSKSDLDAIDTIVATGKALQTLEGHSDRVSVERPNGEGTIDA